MYNWHLYILKRYKKKLLYEALLNGDLEKFDFKRKQNQAEMDENTVVTDEKLCM